MHCMLVIDFDFSAKCMYFIAIFDQNALYISLEMGKKNEINSNFVILAIVSFPIILIWLTSA